MQEQIVKLKNIKLLFVEDEVDLLEIISDTLTKLELEYLTAKNGQEALNLLESNYIDIVVTDINMSVMNGLELIEVMKNLYPNIKVIIMSAHTDKEYIQKASDLGVKDYLIKPFDFIKFIDLVATLD